jgi:electron transfer flavoprotein beta subunit
MRIVVLLKQVPDTWEVRRLDLVTGLLDREANERVVDDVGERALEVALRYKDGDRSSEVIVLSMGPTPVIDGLRKGLSMGADSAVCITDPALAGADAVMTATTLAAALKHTGFDLVVAGSESTDGRGGVIPAMLADHLGLPHATFLDSVVITATEVSGDRGVESGVLKVSAPLPAVISVTERSDEPRFANFKGIMSAKKKPLAQLSLADLGIDPSSITTRARSVIVSTVERPARAAGKKVIDSGHAGDELAEFLISARLV